MPPPPLESLGRNAAICLQCRDWEARLSHGIPNGVVVVDALIASAAAGAAVRCVCRHGQRRRRRPADTTWRRTPSNDDAAQCSMDDRAAQIAACGWAPRRVALRVASTRSHAMAAAGARPPPRASAFERWRLARRRWQHWPIGSTTTCRRRARWRRTRGGGGRAAAGSQGPPTPRVCKEGARSNSGIARASCVRPASFVRGLGVGVLNGRGSVGRVDRGVCWACVGR